MSEQSNTICWECVNACGDCSWSESGIPVKGWEAEESSRQSSLGTIYIVKACPMFERSTPEKDRARLLRNMESRKDPRVFGGLPWK